MASSRLDANGVMMGLSGEPTRLLLVMWRRGEIRPVHRRHLQPHAI